MDKTSNELLAFFKALSDVTRLKLVGLLAQEDSSVEELAAVLGVNPSTVSHHLSRLREIGLVSARAVGYYNIYTLRTEILQEMAQRMLSENTLPDVVKDLDREAYDRKVLKDYLAKDGTISQIPSNKRKLDVILRYLAEQFDYDRGYSEKEVNDIIAAYNEDISGLRRDLISVGFLDRERDGSNYWRVKRED